MALSPNQIKELVDIIDRYHIIFAAKHVPDVLTDDDKRILQKQGIPWKRAVGKGGINAAFRFGMLAEALGHKAAKALSFQKFKKFLTEGKFLPATSIEKNALKSVELQTYQDIKGLGNKISRDLSHTLIEVDRRQRAKYLNIIKEETRRAIEERESLSELSSELANKTQDWSRDWDRIADYNLHLAFSTGKAEELLKKYGSEAKVYFEVLPTACKECRRLYLNGDGTPKIFSLREILNNGTNIGRKTKDWKPVINSVHPYCRCEMFRYDDQYDYNIVTHMFDKPKPYVSPVGRKTHVRTYLVTKDNELVEV